MTDAQVLGAVERALVERFGQLPQRASRSFLGVEPIDVLRFAPAPDERAYVTLGMARRPMTSPTATVTDVDGPRAELLLMVRDPSDSAADVWRHLAVLAAAPAVEGLVYRDGASVDLGRPLVPGSSCVGIVAAAPAEVPPITTPEGPVTILHALPATGAELAWCRARGTRALRDRWTAHRTDLLDLGRASVRLD
jgi:hypothetical protein